MKPGEIACIWIVLGLSIFFFIGLYGEYLVSDVSGEGHTLEWSCAVIWILIQMLKLGVVATLIGGIGILICYALSYLKKRDCESEEE